MHSRPETQGKKRPGRQCGRGWRGPGSNASPGDEHPGLGGLSLALLLQASGTQQWGQPRGPTHSGHLPKLCPRGSRSCGPLLGQVPALGLPCLPVTYLSDWPCRFHSPFATSLRAQPLGSGLLQCPSHQVMVPAGICVKLHLCVQPGLAVLPEWVLQPRKVKSSAHGKGQVTQRCTELAGHGGALRG